MRFKRVAESALDCYPMEIFPGDLNSRGTIFGGKILATADKVAGYVAMKHSGLECVTLAVDSVRFLAPAKQGEVLVFKAAVNRVWGSSLEVGVKVLADNITAQTSRHILSAYFTFVAVDGNDKPQEIGVQLRPETPGENRRHEEAQRRREHRFALAHRL
ncbi:MAG: acyl-CoA thioesterase [Candidatus Yanofskybacteria bacterium]|nr:acyl-CoA thioesterase [Candidatus Yanofskybacteria bacterium]